MLVQPKTYSEVMNAAFSEFQNKYESYSKQAAEIEPLTKSWLNRNLSLDPNKVDSNQESELNQDIEKYKGYRGMREDTKKIIGLFEQAITYCAPPTLDPSMLQTLAKMGFDIEEINTKYKELFSDKLKDLKEQKEKIQKLYEKILPELAQLRIAGEPFAVHCAKRTSWIAVPAALYSVLNQTPYFNALVTQRKEVLKDLENMSMKAKSEEKAASANTGFVRITANKGPKK